MVITSATNHGAHEIPVLVTRSVVGYVLDQVETRTALLIWGVVLDAPKAAYLIRELPGPVLGTWRRSHRES